MLERQDRNSEDQALLRTICTKTSRIKKAAEIKKSASKAEMRKVLTVIAIVVVVLVVLIIIAASRDDRRGRGQDRRGSLRRDADRLLGIRDSHPQGCCKDKGCCNNGDRPHPPRDVCCSSEERFSVDVKWKRSASAVDHYRIYVKFLKECDQQSESSTTVQDSTSGSSDHSVHGANWVRGDRHPVNCGCNQCSSSSSSSSSESRDSRPPRCECGPHNYDKIINVPGCEQSVRISDIKKRAVCVAVTAVSRCGRESWSSNCCETCIKGKCKLYPCIVKSNCTKLNLRWERVHCARCIRIYYDGELMFELPGDAEGVKKLPPIDGTATVVTVTTKNEANVESEHFKVSKACPCKGGRCGQCKTCNRDHQDCTCRKKKRTCFKCQSPEESCRCKGKRTSAKSHSRSASSDSHH